MAEEHNLEEASNHTLCSKHCLKEQQMSTANIAVEKNLSASQQPPETVLASVSTGSAVVDSVPEVAVKSQPRNRCASCNRRLGLTGFTCRCGTTFCGTHRYPEMHGCTFDFKTLGKEAIARANPVIKAAKLEKI